MLQEKIAFDFAFHLAKYPAIIQDVILNYEPCTLVNYLMSLSHLISQSFDVLWVMGQPEPVANLLRVELYLETDFEYWDSPRSKECKRSNTIDN